MSKGTSISTRDLRQYVRAFDEALRDAQSGDGTIDMNKLRREVADRAHGAKMARALEAGVDAVERHFTTVKTVRTGCGRSERLEAPVELVREQARAVFEALLEALRHGVDKLDRNRDGKVVGLEVDLAHGETLGGAISRDMADAVVERAEPKPSTGATGCGRSKPSC
ncbi:MAG: hypothetical protein HYZ27_05810 [Deltaproteobacteria bacterium]|nr:hypothetical protein [Deltaproteobacteria bacterium]